MRKSILAESRRAVNYGLLIGIVGVMFSICFDSWNDLIRALGSGGGYVHYFFWNSAFGGACRSYLLPVFSTLSFATGFSADVNSHMVLFVSSREGKTQYGVAKYIVTVVSGGLIVAIGMGLLFLLLSLVFPVAADYNFAAAIDAPFHNWIASEYPALYGLVEAGNGFLTGALYTGAAVFLSLFIRDKLVVIVSPYLFSFLLVQGSRILRVPDKYRLDFLLAGRVILRSSVHTFCICATIVSVVVGLLGVLFVIKVRRGINHGLYC